MRYGGHIRKEDIQRILEGNDRCLNPDCKKPLKYAKNKVQAYCSKECEKNFYSHDGLFLENICNAISGVACEVAERVPVSVPGSGGFRGAGENCLRLGKRV